MVACGCYCSSTAVIADSAVSAKGGDCAGLAAAGVDFFAGVLRNEARHVLHGAPALPDIIS